MHDEFTKDDLRRLMQVKTENAVSLYMPTNRNSTEIQKDNIRLKNLLTQTEDDLMARGMRRPDAKHLLQPAQDLLDEIEFWRNQSAGLAIFLSPTTKPEIYRLPLRFNVVGQISYRFYVKPLLRQFSHVGHYYVLALSQQNVRFFRGDRDEMAQLELENLPTSIEEALGEWEPNSELQFHTGTGRTSDDGRQGAMFHGHAGSEPQMKDEMLRFFRHIDKALHPVLREDSAPLVLAGVEYLHPIYAEATEYSGLMSEGHAGNPDESSAEELHAATWPLVEPVFRQQMEEDQGSFAELAGTGRTGEYVDDIATAAFQGRVETIFLPRDRRVWGKFDSELGKVTMQEEPVDVAEGASQDNMTPNGVDDVGKEDLLDLIAMHAYLNGGAVHIIDAEDMPGKGAAAAIYRF